MLLTYAIGDIHGSLAKLQALIVQCEQHAQELADGRPKAFVFVGDYIDRGPHSAGVIDYLLSLQARFGDGVVALKGNHEAMLLGVIDGTASPRLWFAQGGVATLESYGVEHPSELPPAHLAWLRALRLSYDDGRRFFVHAGVNPELPLAAQREQDLLWIREPFLSDDRDYGRLIVHGHTPLPDGKPDIRDNRIDIDTAAVFGGPLTAAVFDDAQVQPVAFIQAG